MKLGALAVIEPQGLNEIDDEKEEWEEIEMAVDSGAGETVMSEEALKCIDGRRGKQEKESSVRSSKRRNHTERRGK